MKRKAAVLEQIGGKKEMLFMNSFDKSQAMDGNVHASGWVVDEMLEAIDALEVFIKNPNDENFLLVMAETLDGVILADMYGVNYYNLFQRMIDLNPSTVRTYLSDGSVRNWYVEGLVHKHNALKHALMRLDSSATFPKAYLYWKLKSIFKGREAWKTYDLHKSKDCIIEAFGLKSSKEGGANGNS